MLNRVDWVLLPDLVVLNKVLVKMSLELLVPDEPQSAVAALELDAFVQLGNADDVEPTNTKGSMVGLKELTP